MSRIGMQPIEIPAGVEVMLDSPRLSVKGSLGELRHELPGKLEVDYDGERRLLRVKRLGDDRRSRALHGLHRALIANMVEGVSRGVEKRMEIHGTGYNVNLRGNRLVLQVGYCHEVVFDLPENVSVQIERNAAQPDQPAVFTIKGIDKQQVGQFAARVRSCRPPEPYKGKGVRYAGEYVRRKVGKAFAGIEA